MIKLFIMKKSEGFSSTQEKNSYDFEREVKEAILSHPSRDKDIRPWGGFITLWEDRNFKVKILFVLPGKRLSLQRHKFRKEKWMIADGSALITKGDKKFIMEKGNTVMVEQNELHRVENISKDKVLKIVEIWMGEKLLEDDIERLEDDFGRA
jgi:mannose-6-phosphate isomerase-like protein (cupin superfamily)